MSNNTSLTKIESNDQTTVKTTEQTNEITSQDIDIIVSNLGGVESITPTDKPTDGVVDTTKPIFPFVLAPSYSQEVPPSIVPNVHFGVQYDSGIITGYYTQQHYETAPININYNYPDGMPIEESCSDYHQFLFMNNPVVKSTYCVGKNGRTGIINNTIAEMLSNRSAMASLFDARVKFLKYNLAKYIYDTIRFSNSDEKSFIKELMEALDSQMYFDFGHIENFFSNYDITNTADMSEENNAIYGINYDYNDLYTTLIAMSKSISANVYNVYIFNGMVDNVDTGLSMTFFTKIEPAIIEFIKNIFNEFLFCYRPASLESIMCDYSNELGMHVTIPSCIVKGSIIDGIEDTDFVAYQALDIVPGKDIYRYQVTNDSTDSSK